MKHLKLLATLLLLGLAGLAAIAALNWEKLLSPEQKLNYGLRFSAVEDFRQRASGLAAAPGDLDTYVDVVTGNGNLGRALYLHELYGAAAPGLAELRAEIELSIRAAIASEFHSVSASAAAQAHKEQPLFQALLFLDGYRHALLGDWASAKNYFAKVEERKLAPELRQYWKYFLARSYRLSGDEKLKAEVPKLLLSVLDTRPAPDLSAKARYNLIAYYLSPAFTGGNGIALARDQELPLRGSTQGWAVQKAYTDIGSYYISQVNLAEAWPRIVTAVMLDSNSESSAAAVKLCLDTLRDCANGTLSGGRDGDGALTLELPEGLLLASAQSSINRGDVQDCSAVFQNIAKQIKDRARWEELKVALALCYRKAGDLEALRRLLTEATLANFSDATTGRILFQLASLEEQRGLWNAAIEHYRGCARLGGEDAAQAWYGCYHVIKRVQDPLNLDSAEQYLRSAVASGSSDPAYGKAVEELIPLLIFRDKLTDAARLARDVAERPLPQGSSAAEAAAHERLQSLGWSWRAYLADKRGDRSEAAAARARIPCRYWSYYELLNNYPPRPELSGTAAVLAQPESAGEYFAGLGMSVAAAEYFDGAGEPDNQLLLYLRLRNQSARSSLATTAYEATGLLESGSIHEQALLDHVLALAYPRPFDDDLLPAAKRMRIEPELMYAVIKKESAFIERNVSDQGAEGLMQVMPDTASFLNNSYSLGIDLARRKEVRNNLLLGAANLRMLFDQLGQSNLRGVIAGHNKGAGNYQKWQRLYPADEVLFTELIPNEENESFSKLVWKYYKINKWLDER